MQIFEKYIFSYDIKTKYFFYPTKLLIITILLATQPKTIENDFQKLNLDHSLMIIYMAYPSATILCIN